MYIKFADVRSSYPLFPVGFLKICLLVGLSALDDSASLLLNKRMTDVSGGGRRMPAVLPWAMRLPRRGTAVPRGGTRVLRRGHSSTPPGALEYPAGVLRRTKGHSSDRRLRLLTLCFRAQKSPVERKRLAGMGIDDAEDYLKMRMPKLMSSELTEIHVEMERMLFSL